MAFLDWPLSNGSLNPDGWTEHADQLAEHSHRLLGMKVGVLSLIACLWVYIRDERSWVRTLGRLLVWVVVLQGVMGGARVRLDSLNTLADSNVWGQTFAVLHALGAQVTVGLWVALTLSQSPGWIRRVAVKAPRGLLILGYVCVGGLMIQVLLGALMRQNDAGLAMPTFPLTPQGYLWPSVWSLQSSLHFAHRAWACFVTITILCFLFNFMRYRFISQGWGWIVGLVAVAMGLQWLL
ncbi:MAG TPA: COX15/CtaA family protein, partial [Opitutales bacterium]|nr:COX15/CtaA family protein [Opitutales bacterium]